MAIRLLVVDEDENVLDVSEAFLGKKDGIEVATETDPERALDRVRDGEFEAVVSDLTMGSIDGLELCRRLRESGTDVPFLLFTGRSADEVADDTDCVTALVQKGAGTEQYDVLAEHVRDAVA